jgi:sigma54-dependent transcription regulator
VGGYKVELIVLLVLYLIWASRRSRRESAARHQTADVPVIQTFHPDGRSMMNVFAEERNILLSAWSEQALTAVAEVYGVYFAIEPATRADLEALGERLATSQQLLQANFDAEIPVNRVEDGDSRQAERLRTAVRRLGDPYRQLLSGQEESDLDYYGIAEEFIEAWENFPHLSSNPS